MTGKVVEASSSAQLTRERILNAAAELFFESGYHATSVRDIAAKVGIKAGSLYNYFPGKQHMLVEIGRVTTRALLDGATERLDGVADPEERLHRLLVWHVSFHCDNQLWCRVTDTQLSALDPDNRVAIVKLRDEYEQLLRGILTRGQKQKRWRVPEMRIVSIGIETMCNEVAGWYRPNGRLSPEEVGHILADFVLTGLGAQPPKTSTDNAARNNKQKG